MEWESDSPCRSHTPPGQGCRSPGRGSCGELEFRDCGATPGRGLLLTVEKWIEGRWGRRLQWEMPVEESQAAMEARRYLEAEPCVGGGAITVASLSLHASICSSTTERLAHQTPDALNYSQGGCMCLRGPSMCLTCQTTEKDPRQASPLSAWMGGATEKDWPRRLSDSQLQEAREKTLIGP